MLEFDEVDGFDKWVACIKFSQQKVEEKSHLEDKNRYWVID